MMRTKHGMIVGCYSVDLYCAIDHNKLGYGFYKTDLIQIAGTSEANCLKQARKAGWVITMNKVLCPQHKHLKFTKLKQEETVT